MAKRNKRFSESEEYSIEDILAEFSGEENQKQDEKIPSTELNKKARDIVFEEKGYRESAEIDSSEEAFFQSFVTREEPRKVQQDEIQDDDMDFFEEFAYAKREDAVPEENQEPEAAYEQENQKPDSFSRQNVSDTYPETSETDDLKYRETVSEEGNAQEAAFFHAEEASSADFPEEDVPQGKAETEETGRSMIADRLKDITAVGVTAARGLKGAFDKILGGLSRAEYEEKSVYFGQEYAVGEPVREAEPEPRSESVRFGEKHKSLTFRSLAAYVLSGVLLLFTVWYEFSGHFPFGIGSDLVLLSGISGAIQILVMALAIDVLLDGLFDLIKGQPGVESLAFISSLAVLGNVFYLICSGSNVYGLPYSLVSCFALSQAIRGKKLYRSAMANSLSVASSSSVRYGILSDSGTIEERSVLKKVGGKVSGFYRNIVSADFSEILYSFASPILVVLSVIFSVISAFGHSFGHFLFSLSSMLAISTTFTCFTAFSLPFENAVRKTKDTGGTVAGWGGAAVIHDADGSIITDEDVFPLGTISLQGYKIVEGLDTNKVIRYASSLIIASDSGISKVFTELLHSMNLPMEEVEDFSCYEGGMGATVRTEQVLVGSAGFMNLMSVRIPGGVETKNAIFAAINGELTAQFLLNYVPANSVQSALLSLLKTRSPMVFAVRDFNVTPAVIRQKFKVPIEDIEYIPSKDCYRLSDDSDAELYDTSAVILREGLGPFADIIRRGRQTYTLTLLTSIISAVTAYVGIVLIFILCWRNAYHSASVFNTFLYLSAMHLPMMTYVKWTTMSK